MWQMRNEELETRLHTWVGRCWSLKCLSQEQARLITALQQERAEWLTYYRRCQALTENTCSFARYEWGKISQALREDHIIERTLEQQNQQMQTFHLLEGDQERYRSVINLQDSQLREA